MDPDFFFCIPLTYLICIDPRPVNMDKLHPNSGFSLPIFIWVTTNELRHAAKVKPMWWSANSKCLELVCCQTAVLNRNWTATDHMVGYPDINWYPCDYLQWNTMISCSCFLPCLPSKDIVNLLTNLFSPGLCDMVSRYMGLMGWSPSHHDGKPSDFRPSLLGITRMDRKKPINCYRGFTIGFTTYIGPEITEIPMKMDWWPSWWEPKPCFSLPLLMWKRESWMEAGIDSRIHATKNKHINRKTDVITPRNPHLIWYFGWWFHCAKIWVFFNLPEK